MIKFANKELFIEFCNEVLNSTSDKYQTVVFADHSISKIIGSWEANKEIRCIFMYKSTFENVYNGLYESFQDNVGIPDIPYKK